MTSRELVDAPWNDFVDWDHWKHWPGDEEILVSDYGEVMSYKSRWGKNLTLMQPSLSNSGYLIVAISGTGVQTVHRLVAETWIPNPLNLEQVNHIDGIKTHNHVENLEWMTRSQNAKHSYDIGLRTGPKRMKVRCNETGEIFDSQLEAANHLGINQGDISNIIRGKQTTAGGFTFTHVLGE